MNQLYTMTKNNKTNIKTSNVYKVLDGDIDLFIQSNLERGV